MMLNALILTATALTVGGLYGFIAGYVNGYLKGKMESQNE